MGQRLMAQADTWLPAHAMPRRVIDGVLSETLCRPVWCLVKEATFRTTSAYHEV
jgi:hypothetical protein